MLPVLTLQTFSCQSSYAIETIDESCLAAIRPYFDNLPQDPYLTGDYRFRRFSRFQIEDGEIIHLPHDTFIQSKVYNRLLGDVQREYVELDESLIALHAFKHALMSFWDFCELCSTHHTVGVHQIRITTRPQQQGSPAPEGCHQDGVDMVGVFCVDRSRITGGETHLYPVEQQESPVFSKVLNPGELLVFNDHQFFHFTTPIAPEGNAMGTRDVFVFTCPHTPFDPTS